MALKGTRRSPATKSILGLGVVLGSIACAAVANMFVTTGFRYAGADGTIGHVITECVLYGLAFAFAAGAIWLTWPDPTPEQAAIAEQNRRDRAQRLTEKKTPLFDEQRAADVEAMRRVLDED